MGPIWRLRVEIGLDYVMVICIVIIAVTNIMLVFKN